MQPGVVGLPGDAEVAAGLGDVAGDFLGVTDDRQPAGRVPGQLSFGQLGLPSFVRDPSVNELRQFQIGAERGIRTPTSLRTTVFEPASELSQWPATRKLLSKLLSRMVGPTAAASRPIEESDRSEYGFGLVGREGVEPPQLSRRFYRPLGSPHALCRPILRTRAQPTG
jgi:hypothetical protein